MTPPPPPPPDAASALTVRTQSMAHDARPGSSPRPAPFDARTRARTRWTRRTGRWHEASASTSPPPATVSKARGAAIVLGGLVVLAGGVRVCLLAEAPHPRTRSSPEATKVAGEAQASRRSGDPERWGRATRRSRCRERSTARGDDRLPARQRLPPQVVRRPRRPGEGRATRGRGDPGARPGARPGAGAARFRRRRRSLQSKANRASSRRRICSATSRSFRLGSSRRRISINARHRPRSTRRPSASRRRRDRGAGSEYPAPRPAQVVLARGVPVRRRNSITQRWVENGALVTSGNCQPLYKIAAMDPARASSHPGAPRRGAEHPRADVVAKVNLREYPGRPFDGKIARAAGELDPATRTMNTEVRVPNPDGFLIAGMYADVALSRFRCRTGSSSFPSTALISDAKGQRSRDDRRPTRRFTSCRWSWSATRGPSSRLRAA